MFHRFFISRQVRDRRRSLKRWLKAVEKNVGRDSLRTKEAFES